MINNPSPKRNIHLLGKKRPKVRYLLLIVMGFVVLCVSRPYHYPKTDYTENVSSEVRASTSPVDQEAKLTHSTDTVEEILVRRGDTFYDILRARNLPDSKILIS